MGERESRKGNATASARIAARPVVAWLGHTVVFTGFALLLQVTRSGPVDWVRAIALGAAIASAVVAGTVLAHRRTRSGRH